VIANSPANLLQEFTRHKLDAALDTVETVKSKSHPFPEGPLALDGIRQHLIELRERIVRPGQSSLIAKNYCRVALEQLAETIPLVGFVDRSAEVDGPVEFHDPFSRIVRALLGDEAKLILSSMWNFSPYTITYPDEVPKHVENFVYVSFSVSESDNSILTPLAAHELGHNIWKKENISPTLKSKVGAEVVQLIQTTYAKKWASFAGPIASAGDLVGQVAWQPAHLWAMKQLEESFCDFIGLFLFGPSYLYAFAHFISPGLNAGEPKYPQAYERFSALREEALKHWAVDDAFSEALFDAAVRPPELDNNLTREFLLQLADDTRRNLLGEITDLAYRIIKDADLLYESVGTDKLISQLDEGVPCAGAATLMEIVNAGWVVFISRFYRATGSSNWGFPIAETPKVLNELILKSFEIHDIEQRLERSSCSTLQKLAV
jgi:hypothetical protein